MATKRQMQARSSADGQLYSWLSVSPDFAGSGYEGPGTPLDITQYAGPVGPSSLPALTIAFTAPKASATLLQGRVVVLTGTISRASTVTVSKGGTLIGSATVSGNTWLYSYTLLAGDVGALTFNARATDIGSPATADAAPVSVTVQETFDKSGALLYVPSVPGNPGDTIGTLASLFGGSSLTPSPTAPKVDANAVGGNNAAFLPNDGAPYQYFTADPLAPNLRSATGNWTLILHYRIDKQADQPFVALLRSDAGTNDELFIRTVGECITFKRVVGGVTQTLTASRSPDPYSDTMMAVRCAAGVVTIFERSFGKTIEMISHVGTITGGDLPPANDRLTFGASIWNAVGEIMSGWQNGWGVWASALTDTNIHDLFNEWSFDNYLVPQAKAWVMISPGESIMAPPNEPVTGGGMRDFVSDFWSREGLSIYTYGGVQSGGSDNGYGEGRYGFVRNTFTSSLGGQNHVQITNQALLDIANSPTEVRYWMCFLGTYENDFLVAPATICANIVADFTTVMAALLAQSPRAFVSVSPLLPIFDASIQANSAAVHALFAANVLAPIRAIAPAGRIYAGDMFLALGGAYSVANFGSASVGIAGHPNRTGNAQMMLDPVNGMMNAKNELGQTLAQKFRIESPTASRPLPLSGSILTPSTGTSIAHGTPQVFTFDCSRMGSTPVFKVDGVARGIATAIDSIDYTVFLGSYNHRRHNTFSYSWTPGIGDVGSRVVTVTFTDVDGVTVATSPSINVTVT